MKSNIKGEEKVIPHFFKIGLLILIILGVLLRLYDLRNIPPGLNNDEGVYAYYSLRYLTDGHLYVFAKSGFGQETSIGYCYALLSKLFGISVLLIRAFSSLLAILILLMFYQIGKYLWDRNVALFASSLAGISFLLIFYGRIGYPASCVLLVAGAAFYSLLRYLESGKYRWGIFCAALSLLGLLTYATYRVMIVYLFIISLLMGRGGKKRVVGVIFAAFAPVAMYLGCILRAEGSLRPIFERGMHNLRVPEFSAWNNYLYSFLLFFYKAPREFGIVSRKFFGDGVHLSLYDAFSRPEGIVLSMIMFACLAASVVVCYRRIRSRQYRDPVVLLVIWAMFYFLIIGYVGPSYTRLLGILVPLMLLSAYIMHSTVIWFCQRGGWQRRAMSGAVVLLLIIVLAETMWRMGRLGESNPQALFLYDWNAVKMIEQAKARSSPEDRVLVFSSFGIDAMKYLTFDIPYHDNFSNFAISHFQQYEKEKRPKRLYVLMENPESTKLVKYIEDNFRGVSSEKFRIAETNMDYMEVLAPAVAQKQGADITEKSQRDAVRNLSKSGKSGQGGEFHEPRGIAVDASGNVYVADFRNYRVLKLDGNCSPLEAWGEQGNAAGQFNDPCGVAVDSKKMVYVADTFNHRVQVFNEHGKFLFHFEGGFFAPRGLAVDGKGMIWVADSGNGMVKLFSGDGKPIKTIGKKGSGRGEFMSPVGIAADRKGRIYVADAGNKRVQILDREGNYLSEFKVDGWQDVVFNEPYLDIDEKGDVYLTDPPGHRALRYSNEGKLLGALKPSEAGKPLLQFPMGIAVEKDGPWVYLVDCRNHMIRKFSKRDFR